MNTVCKQCDRVVLIGHHECPADGAVVRVTKTTPGVLRVDMLEHYGRRPSTPEHMIRVSPKPVDSAMRSIPLAIQTLTLGNDYYGVSIPITHDAAIKRHNTMHNSLFFDKQFLNAIEGSLRFPWEEIPEDMPTFRRVWNWIKETIAYFRGRLYL